MSRSGAGSTIPPALSRAKTPDASNEAIAVVRRALSAHSARPAAAVAAKNGGQRASDRINLTALEELKKAFDDADQDGSDGLEIDEFVKAFGTVLGEENLSKQQLTHLFMKIDANSDGSVDWDEFTNFLLMETQAVNRMEDRALFPTFDREPDEDLPACERHRDMITNISYVEKLDKFVLTSRDGSWSVWSPDLQMQRTIQSGDGRSWVTSSAYSPMSNIVAVGSMDRRVTFYDCNTWEPVSRLCNSPGFTRFSNSPLSIHCATFHDRGDVFTIGDDGGNITILHLQEPNWHACDGKGGSHNTVGSHLEHVGFLRLHRVHTDWVTKVEYSHALGCLITCSLDKTVKFCDIEKGRATDPVKRTYAGHTKGVHSFAFSKAYKFMASCGLEREIRIWDPYTCKSVSTLAGHCAPLKKVILDDQNNLMISQSVDKIIKIWDIRTFKCTQTLQDNQTYRPEDSISDVFYDRDHNRILSASNQLHCWVSFDSAADAAQSGHEQPIRAALYNTNFQQVVSVDVGGSTELPEEKQGSTVRVWDIDSGSCVFTFNAKCNISAMSFDSGGRRLITGSHDGSIRIWNFSNGQCLAHYAPYTKTAHQRNCEITAVSYLEVAGKERNASDAKKYTLSTGWDRMVRAWNDDGEDYGEIPAYCMPRHAQDANSRAHCEDVMCIARCDGLIATGDYGGQICLWHIESGQLKDTFRASYSTTCGLGEATIEAIVHLKSATAIAACGSDGVIRLWDYRTSRLVLEYPAGFDREENLLAMASSCDDAVIIVGDSSGLVKVFNVHINATTKTASLEEAAFFRAHDMQISSLDFVYRAEGMYILTGSADQNIRVWSLAGEPMGTFGQRRRWHLGKPITTKPGASTAVRCGSSSPYVKDPVTTVPIQQKPTLTVDVHDYNNTPSRRTGKRASQTPVRKPLSPLMAALVDAEDCEPITNHAREIACLIATPTKAHSNKLRSSTRGSPLISKLKPRPIEWVPYENRSATKEFDDPQLDIYTAQSAAYQAKSNNAQRDRKQLNTHVDDDATSSTDE